MAHKIIACDLGSSSIKLARFDASFRKVQLLDCRVLPAAVDPAEKPEERIPRQLSLLAQTMAQEKYVAEEVTLGLPGDVLTFRLVDLPFSNPKQIEQTLGYELESQILTPVEELLVDFVIVGNARIGGVGPGGGVPMSETRVVAACAPKTLVESIVKAAQELGLPLRTVGAAPLSYAAYFAPTEPPAPVVEGEEQPPGPAGPGSSLVVDIGCDSTAACVLRGGKPEMARSIGRGGRKVTEAIMAAFKLDETRAEEAKRDSSFLAHRGIGHLSASQAHMDAAVRDAMMPLVRELRQTIASYRAAYGDIVERVWLCGGGARISGLQEFLAEQLLVPVQPVPWLSHAGWADGPALADKRDLLVTATGLGAATVQPGLQVNFRKGEFAYRSDYSFLRDKAVYVAASLALVLLFAGFNAWASLRGLRKEHDVLAAGLKKATVEVFGKERSPDDAQAISDEVKAGPKGIGQLPIPTMTAFDLLDEISKAVPPSDKVRLDILELDIKPKKTSIKATTETAQQVDDFADALKKIDCFEEVQKGRLATVSVPAPYVPPDQQDKEKDKKDDRPSELKQFTLSIKTSCP